MGVTSIKNFALPLIVGILAYFGYNYLSARISSLVYSMESATIKLMDALSEPENSKKEE